VDHAERGVDSTRSAERLTTGLVDDGEPPIAQTAEQRPSNGVRSPIWCRHAVILEVVRWVIGGWRSIANVADRE